MDLRISNNTIYIWHNKGLIMGDNPQLYGEVGYFVVNHPGQMDYTEQVTSLQKLE